MSWWLYLLVVVAGLMAGFVNSMAGSGSLVTLPSLMLAGLPAGVANGTNRIGIILQSTSAVIAYRRKGMRHFRKALWLLLPCVLGAGGGAMVASKMPTKVMDIIIICILLITVAMLFVKPKRWERPISPVPQNLIRKPLFVIGLLAIGFYGGFIQVGSGYLLLYLLVLAGGFDVMHANTFKHMAQISMNCLALPIFFFHHQVDWLLGFVLAVGMITGAWIGAQMAIKKGAKFVRILLVCTVILLAAVQIYQRVRF